MKRLSCEQGSLEWLQWRRVIISASDASSIMNCNPYCDRMELRLRKLGFLPDKSNSDAMMRGQLMEPIARDHFHKIYNNLIFTPAVVESSEFLFLGASLDGITDDGKAILEIKCGVKSHEMAKKGEIPEYYKCQILHQLICTRAEKCFYFSYQSVDDNVMIEVLPEKDFEEHYVPLAEMFWMDLIFKKPEILIEKEKS